MGSCTSNIKTSCKSMRSGYFLASLQIYQIRTLGWEERTGWRSVFYQELQETQCTHSLNTNEDHSLEDSTVITSNLPTLVHCSLSSHLGFVLCHLTPLDFPVPYFQEFYNTVIPFYLRLLLSLSLLWTHIPVIIWNFLPLNLICS